MFEHRPMPESMQYLIVGLAFTTTWAALRGDMGTATNLAEAGAIGFTALGAGTVLIGYAEAIGEIAGDWWRSRRSGVSE